MSHEEYWASVRQYLSQVPLDNMKNRNQLVLPVGLVHLMTIPDRWDADQIRDIQAFFRSVEPTCRKIEAVFKSGHPVVVTPR